MKYTSLLGTFLTHCYAKDKSVSPTKHNFSTLVVSLLLSSSFLCRRFYSTLSLSIPDAWLFYLTLSLSLPDVWLFYLTLSLSFPDVWLFYLIWHCHYQTCGCVTKQCHCHYQTCGCVT